jgi:2',3'-cyclic-nucleotide 2'-phosphodiesterase
MHLVVGTHTHVPTADARILPGGTAYVSDVGMTGSADGIIGFDKEDFLVLFLGRRPSRIGVSKGPSRLSAVVVEVEVESRRAIGNEDVYREST